MAERRSQDGGEVGGSPPPPRLPPALEENGVQLPLLSGYPLGTCQAAPETSCLGSPGQKKLPPGALQSLCAARARLPGRIAAGNDSNPSCQSCKEDKPGSAEEKNLLSVEKDRQSMCEYASIPCHLGCGQMVIQKQLEHHLQSCCVKASLHSGCHQTGPANDHQNLAVVFSREEGCRFSRIGCSFKGTAEDREAHEADDMGAHLKLLLKHVKELKAQLSPTGDGVNTWFTDTRVLTGIYFNGTPQRPLEVDFLSGLPLYEGKTPWQALLRRPPGVSLLESKLQVFEDIASVLRKEMTASRQKFVAIRGQRGLDQDMIRGLELKIADLQRCLVQKDAALSKLEERLRSSEQASYDGTFLWKITDVHHKCYEAVCGKMYSFQSPAFYTSRYGYKLCMRIYLNGEGRGKGSHVSLFLVLLRGDYDALLQWPFVHKVTFMLLSQNNTDHLVNTIHPDPTSPSFQRPMAEMNEASGFTKFIPLTKLQLPKYAYIKEGTIFLRCITEASP